MGLGLPPENKQHAPLTLHAAAVVTAIPGILTIAPSDGPPEQDGPEQQRSVAVALAPACSASVHQPLICPYICMSALPTSAVDIRHCTPIAKFAEKDGLDKMHGQTWRTEKTKQTVYNHKNLVNPLRRRVYKGSQCCQQGTQQLTQPRSHSPPNALYIQEQAQDHHQHVRSLQEALLHRRAATRPRGVCCPGGPVHVDLAWRTEHAAG